MTSKTMMKSIKAIRGMNDCLPEQTVIWQEIERKLIHVLNSYGYSEIRMPIVEYTPLFRRAIGEVTDVVEKEMYTFEDRNNESLTLRPEGTASCVRAGIEHGLLYNQEQRLWYLGPMFRYERPQKGRYRQFHQMGVEAFGLVGPDIDAELIQLNARWWKALGISDHVSLEINCIGSIDDRNRYREALVAFLEQHKDQLDEDCLRRMYTNPMRVLDSKNPDIQSLLNKAPRLSEYLCDESKQHFDGFRALLEKAGIEYKVNERLVRGLDYYNLTVFEWVTTSLGSQGTVCGGGRYDGLVEQLGGKPTQGVGFAMGMERLVLLVQTVTQLNVEPGIDIYVISANSEIIPVAQSIAEQLRDGLPTLRIMTSYQGGGFKKQFTRADKLNAKLAIVIGEEEVESGQVVIKNLLNGEQIKVPQADVVQECSILLQGREA